MLWYIFIGVIIGAGLRLLSFGQFVFWLYLAIQSVYVLVVLVANIKSRPPLASPPSAGGHLSEYVVLSLVIDSGLILGYWFRLPWQSENIVILFGACLVFASAIVVARRIMVRQK